MSGKNYCRRCGEAYNDALPSCPNCQLEIPRTVGKDSLVLGSGALIDLLARHQDPDFRALARHVRAGVDYELSMYFLADLIRSLNPEPPDTPP